MRATKHDAQTKLCSIQGSSPSFWMLRRYCLTLLFTVDGLVTVLVMPVIFLATFQITLALYVYILVGCGVIAKRPLVSLLEKLKSLNNTVGDWNLNIL